MSTHEQFPLTTSCVHLDDWIERIENAHSHLVLQRWQQVLLLQQLLDDAVAEAKPCAGLRLAAEGGQQPVISPTSEDGAQLPSSISALKDNAWKGTGYCCEEKPIFNICLDNNFGC